MEVEGVPEVDTASDPKVDIVNNPLTDEVNVPIVEHPTNRGNAQPMVKPAITVVRVVIMPDTAIQHSAHPLQGDIHAVIYVMPCVNAIFVCGLQVGVPFRLDLEEAYFNKSRSLEMLIPLSGGIVLRYRSRASHGSKRVS